VCINKGCKSFRAHNLTISNDESLPIHTMCGQRSDDFVDPSEDNVCEVLDLLLDPIVVRHLLSIPEEVIDGNSLSMTSDSSFRLDSSLDGGCACRSSYGDPFPSVSCLSPTTVCFTPSCFPPSLPDSVCSFGPLPVERPTEAYRTCFSCKKSKPVSMFCKNQRRRKGTKSRCKSCVDKDSG
jgi:hypothetical protein